MKLRLNHPQAGDQDLEIPGVGIVHNGDEFDAPKELAEQLLGSPIFEAVEKETKVKGGDK
jgi:hypothetical protein